MFSYLKNVRICASSRTNFLFVLPSALMMAEKQSFKAFTMIGQSVSRMSCIVVIGLILVISSLLTSCVHIHTLFKKKVCV